MEAYKYGLGLGLDNSTLKMLLFDIRGEDVADQDNQKALRRWPRLQVLTTSSSYGLNG